MGLYVFLALIFAMYYSSDFTMFQLFGPGANALLVLIVRNGAFAAGSFDRFGNYFAVSRVFYLVWDSRSALVVFAALVVLALMFRWFVATFRRFLSSATLFDFNELESNGHGLQLVHVSQQLDQRVSQIVLIDPLICSLLWPDFNDKSGGSMRTTWSFGEFSGSISSQAPPSHRAFAQTAQAASAGWGVEDEGIHGWYQDDHGTWHDSSVEAYGDFSGHGDASESPWSDHDGGPGGGL
jgi:hypothetical protein